MSDITIPWQHGCFSYQPSSTGIASMNKANLLLPRWNAGLVLREPQHEKRFTTKKAWAHIKTRFSCDSITHVSVIIHDITSPPILVDNGNATTISPIPVLKKSINDITNDKLLRIVLR
jgi:hypothetical protein